MAVDIAPLIDVVFILLIFFLVTSTFLKDTGIEVQRPQAVAAQSLEPTSMRVSISAEGAIYTEGDAVDLPELRRRVSRFLGEGEDRSVILIPDARAPSGRLVEVMDEAKLAGAKDIAVAARRREGGR